MASGSAGRREFPFSLRIHLHRQILFAIAAHGKLPDDFAILRAGLPHRNDLRDLGETELNIELALDAAHQPDMGEAVPGFQILLAGFRRHHQGFIVEHGAEAILNPGEQIGERNQFFRRLHHQAFDPFEETKSSGLGTGWIYIVMPWRPSITARSMNGLASAARILKFDIFASMQISVPKWRRSRSGLISPIRRMNSCSPVSPLAVFQRYLTVPSNTFRKNGTSS